MRIPDLIGAVLLGQRGHLFPWAPVCLAVGIAVYFGLRAEPSVAALAWAGGIGAVLLLAGMRITPAIAPLVLCTALVLLGCALAGLRAHQVAGPVIGWRYYGPVEGRIVGIDRSASDKVRLTLDRVVLADVAPARTPTRVRLSLHGDQRFLDPAPGQTIIATGHLASPSGPVEPGGFDFQRHAWFQRLGAVGYTRVPVLLLEPPAGGLRVFRLRMALSRYVQDALPGEVGAFAAAVTTGDRAGMGQQTLDALRGSNLAHLLAISGLHMGLLAGFVFAALRLALAFVPALLLRLPSKKVAALGALASAAAYLAMSGGNVATERAFIMVAVALVAILADRRALSLRAVAIAALIVLVLRPEALMGPGFQMSFAATTALVAVFGAMRSQQIRIGPAWAQGIVAVVISSFVAGLATAPIGAAHFNQIAHYGLIANLSSVPVMGMVVVPAAVLALLLAPLGLDWIGLALMGMGLDWILGVAHWASALPGARGQVVQPGPWVLPLLSGGALMVILWQGRARWSGLAPFAAALMIWMQAERPDVLIADTGGLVGVMTPEGRVLSRPKGAGFIAANWLENDGDAAEQSAAAARPAVQLAVFAVRHIHGKRNVGALETCAKGDWLVLSHPEPVDLPCRVFDPPRLRRTGAVAIWLGGDAPKVVTARDVSGARLWNTRGLR